MFEVVLLIIYTFWKPLKLLTKKRWRVRVNNICNAFSVIKRNSILKGPDLANKPRVGKLPSSTCLVPRSVEGLFLSSLKNKHFFVEFMQRTLTFHPVKPAIFFFGIARQHPLFITSRYFVHICFHLNRER